MATSMKFPFVDVTLGPEWRGGNEDLLLLSKFHWVDELSLQGGLFSDASLSVIERVKGPSALRLSDTKTSPEGLGRFLQTKANSISVLDINGPEFDDACLRYLDGMKFLKWLIIGPDCRVTDDGVRDLGKLEELLFLQINARGVTGKHLKALIGLVNLHGLILADTAVHDDVVADLGQNVRLNYLDLSRTEVSGESFEHLACLADLNTLILDETPISDVGLANLRSLPTLEALSLDGTLVGDRHMKIIGCLPHATTISMNNTSVTAAGIGELRNIKSLLTATDGTGNTYIFQKRWASLHGQEVLLKTEGELFLWTETVPQPITKQFLRDD